MANVEKWGSGAERRPPTATDHSPHHRHGKRTQAGRQLPTEALLEVGEEGEGLVAQPVPEARLLKFF